LSQRPALRHHARPAFVALALLSGCSSILAPQPDLSKFFVLTARPDNASIATNQGAPSIGLGPVNLPPYLEREEIATRVAANQIEYSPTDRWAEPLDANFRRVLQRDLAGALGDAQVVAYPTLRAGSLDYRVEVEVEHFERDDKGDSQMTARWIIRDGKTGKPLVARQSTVGHSAQSRRTEASVGALSTDVAELSDQIAGALRILAAKR
jgi:uncharacterized lipoprotein YmbA